MLSNCCHFPLPQVKGTRDVVNRMRLLHVVSSSLPSRTGRVETNAIHWFHMSSFSIFNGDQEEHLPYALTIYWVVGKRSNPRRAQAGFWLLGRNRHTMQCFQFILTPLLHPDFCNDLPLSIVLPQSFKTGDSMVSSPASCHCDKMLCVSNKSRKCQNAESGIQPDGAMPSDKTIGNM
jgi:hypothetical protein